MTISRDVFWIKAADVSVSPFASDVYELQHRNRALQWPPCSYKSKRFPNVYSANIGVARVDERGLRARRNVVILSHTQWGSECDYSDHPVFVVIVVVAVVVGLHFLHIWLLLNRCIDLLSVFCEHLSGGPQANLLQSGWYG